MLPYADYYCDSKLKLAMFSRELQSRMSRSPDYRHVVCHAIHPGFVNTNVWNSGWKTEVPFLQQVGINLLLSRVAVNSEQGALAILYAALVESRGLEKKLLGADGAATAKNVPERYTESIGARFYNRIWERPPRPEVFDKTARARLWNRTLEDLEPQKLDASYLPGALPGLK